MLISSGKLWPGPQIRFSALCPLYSWTLFLNSVWVSFSSKIDYIIFSVSHVRSKYFHIYSRLIINPLIRLAWIYTNLQINQCTQTDVILLMGCLSSYVYLWPISMAKKFRCFSSISIDHMSHLKQHDLRLGEENSTKDIENTET